MAIRIKLPEDREPLFFPSGTDVEFADLKHGDEFEFSDDFYGLVDGNKYRRKYVVVKRIDDASPLNNCGDIIYVKNL